MHNFQILFLPFLVAQHYFTLCKILYFASIDPSITGKDYHLLILCCFPTKSIACSYRNIVKPYFSTIYGMFSSITCTLNNNDQRNVNLTIKVTVIKWGQYCYQLVNTVQYSMTTKKINALLYTFQDV